MAEKSVPVGIDRMVVTTPNLNISPEVLAPAATIGNMKNEILMNLMEIGDSNMLRYKGYPETKSIGAAERHVVKEIREELADEIGKTTSKREIDSILDSMVKAGVVTSGWVTETMAKVVEETPGKIRNGLGINNTKLPGYSEGNATYTANAIYKFIKQATSNEEAMKELMAQPIGYIYYATESNPDRSKPEVTTALGMVYSKLLMENEERYLPLICMMKAAQPVWITYACAGGGIALTQAVNSVRSDIVAGRRCSALVITADTAVYDSKRAHGAECTQGAAATLMWITQNPQLVVVPNQNASMHDSFADFTKWGMETPYVHGKFSEILYVRMVAKAVEALEKRYGDNGHLSAEYFISHVPFPAQARKFAASLFVHYMRVNNPAVLKDIESRIGSEPLPQGFKKLSDLLDHKLYEFNRDTSKAAQKEEELVKYIEEDKDIGKYWDWLKNVRAQEECKNFVKGIHLNEALELPSMIGNSYSSALHVSLFSLLSKMSNASLDNPKTCIACYYGSGAVSQATVLSIVATPEAVKDRMILQIDTKNRITGSEYRTLHNELVKGEPSRQKGVDGQDLVAMDMALLRSDTMPEGFYIRKRNVDGTGEYCYSDGKTITDLRIRH